MDLKLIKTKGWGLEAEVEYNGRTLYVMDTFSPAGFICPPCVIKDAKFGCFQISSPNWSDFFKGNPNHKKELVHDKGWDYLGYGEVISIDPMVVDYGPMILEGGFPTHDSKCVGEFVGGKVERLEVYGIPEKLPQQSVNLWQKLKGWFASGAS